MDIETRGSPMSFRPSSNIDHDRLSAITVLHYGTHIAEGENPQMCAMEAVAWIAREPWSDHPKCACPVIGAFMRSWNDALANDDERTALLMPLIPLIVGTRSSRAVEIRRSLMAADWLVRVHTPAWLRLAGLIAGAKSLSELPEITSVSQIPSIRPVMDAAWTAAWAASNAARDAAWAARDDVSAAAWDAARDAARVARNAARDAALDAARDVVWVALDAAVVAAWVAWDAVWVAGDAAKAASWIAKDYLMSTKLELQQSAIMLIKRMISATDEVTA
jgi:hypothetical protein